MLTLSSLCLKPRRLNSLSRTIISLLIIALTYTSYSSWDCTKPCGQWEGLKEQSHIPQYGCTPPRQRAGCIGTGDCALPTLVDHSYSPMRTGQGQNDRLSDDLGTSLHRTLSLLPDEARMGDLLAPLDMTGTDRIRQMGLRARSFKMLFAAWETLHLVWTKEGVYIRDVVQALYEQPSLTNNLGIDLAQAIHGYDKLRFVLSKMSTLLFPWSMPLIGDHMDFHIRAHNGRRGIVIAAGNKQAPYLLSSIPSMRWLGCHLPIEVMYLGDNDLSPSFQADLESLPGVTTRDLSLMVGDDGWELAGWAAKPFSILFSSFQEVILVDADALFFVNPEVLFDDESYQETGALFFRDRLFMPESKREWLKTVLPHPPSSRAKESRFWTGESGHMQESGVVVVDKWRHFVALLMVAKLNGPDRDTRDGKQGVYEMVYGDKETYWLGWELVGDTDYAFHGGDAGTMGVITEIQIQEDQEASATTDNVGTIDSATICAPQLLHLDLNNRPIWFNGWLLPNKFKGQGQQHTGYFEAYLKEPRSTRDPSPWQLGDSNICCLTSEYLFDFSEEEKAVMDMVIANWNSNQHE